MTTNTVKGYVVGSFLGWLMSCGQDARMIAQGYARREGVSECAVPSTADAILFYMPVLFGTIGAATGFVADCASEVSNYIAPTRPNNRGPALP